MSLNNYNILHKVGQGQYGKVFKAIRKTDNIPVAIKIIAKKLNEKEEKMANLQINIMKQINCPEILKIYEHFKREETNYMVLEYCSKGDLQKVCQGKKGLSEQLVKLIAAELVKALAYLQDKNIAHRDIKLANIYINNYYQIKLADLGFAKIIGEDLLSSYAGTPLNMAPEIFNEKRYTNKCDIWSFGVIVYQMLYGILPFFPKKQTLQDLFNLVNAKNVQFPNYICISDEAEDMIRKCLNKNPDKRISAKQLLKHPWILSASKQEGALQQQLSRIMIQSGLIYLEQQLEQQQNELESSFQEYIKMVHRSIIRFIKQFQLSVKKIAHNFTQCFKIMKKNPVALNALHSLVEDRINQLSSLKILFQLPNKDIVIQSQQYSRTKSAATYLKKLLVNKYQYVADSEMILFKLVRNQFDEYYQIVQPLKELIETLFGTITLNFSYYEDLDKSLIQFLQQKVNNEISNKIVELLAKPSDKVQIILKDIVKVEWKDPQNKYSSLAFYLKNLQAMAQLKSIAK